MPTAMGDLPLTGHRLRAALRVARIIDRLGNATDDVQASYRHALTLGEHPADHLRDAEQLLVRAGLLHRVEGRIFPTPGLAVLAGVDDECAAEVLAAALGTDNVDEGLSEADEAARAALGAAGEEHVAAGLREELVALGYTDLVAAVQRVSLVSDRLGYDVFAPTLTDAVRKLEVKTERVPARSWVRFFLTRNEYETGRRGRDAWALVACRADPSTEQIDTVGWCRVEALKLYLPEDRNGRWTEALVRLPVGGLVSGLPPAV
jgi:hypothetical protein